MGYDLAMPKNGINHVYQAAKEAKANGEDQLSAARKAAEKDGNINEIENNFLISLEKDPRLLERISEEGNDLIIKDYTNMNYQYPPASTDVNKNLEFVETKEPSFNEMKENFKKEFGQDSGAYLEPANPLLTGKLNKIAKALEADPKSTEKLINYAIDMAINVAHPDNEDLEAQYAVSRTKQLVDAFDKVRKGQPLTTTDIQDIQLFIFMDTEHGRLLHEKDGDSGIDGKFGPRTNAALDLFLKEQKIIID